MEKENKIALSVVEMSCLRVLGVDVSGASMEWDYSSAVVAGAFGCRWKLRLRRSDAMEVYVAFTAADILDLLPAVISGCELMVDKHGGNWRVSYVDLNCLDDDSECVFETFSSERLIDAAYQMLRCVAEHG